MENAHVALARRDYSTIESWYHQGAISQLEWEAWHAAREVLHPAGTWSESRAPHFPDIAELRDKIVAQWREDHKSE